MKIVLIISLALTIGILSINNSFADDEVAMINIELVDGNIIDLDKGDQFFRANIDIVNYDPRDGYHYMKVTRLLDNEVIKNTEILPKQIEDNLWSVQILHYIDTTTPDEELLGDYELEIYSEHGLVSSGVQISVIKSSMPQLSTNSTGELLSITTDTEDSTDIEDTTDTEDTTELLEEESQLPDWIRNIFIWYADGTITETDLLSALQYLINQGIIEVDL